MGEGFAGEFAELIGGEVGESIGAWAAYPAGEGVAGSGVGRPPDRGHGGEGEEEAEFEFRSDG